MYQIFREMVFVMAKRTLEEHIKYMKMLYKVNYSSFFVKSILLLRIHFKPNKFHLETHYISEKCKNTKEIGSISEHISYNTYIS